MTEFVLSIDVGGTKTLVGAVDPRGKILDEWTQPTQAGPEDDVQAVVQFARKCCDSFISEAPGARQLIAIAAGFPEYVSADGELTSHEVLRWTTQPSQVLAEEWAAPAGASAPPIVIDSDVRLGALGESVFGAGASTRSMLYVSLGTGISSAFVLDSQVWRGARGEAIALGEHTISVVGFSNLESYSSGAAIQSRYLAATGNTLRGPEIALRAEGNDQTAQSILDSAGLALGEAIANVAQVLDPHAIVLGGGLGSADNRVTRAVRERYKLLADRRARPVALLNAMLSHRSVLLGGAVAAWRAAGIEPSHATPQSSEFPGVTSP